MPRTFPFTRMRRMRSSEFSRILNRECELRPHHLILPVFVQDGHKIKQPISSMPNVHRYSIDQLLHLCEDVSQKGIPGIALFPSISSNLKSKNAKEAYNKKGLLPRTIKEVKKRFPELGIVTDIALDPYTESGQDGIVDASGHVLNDETVKILTLQALCHAEAGADILAPSDMMDGRVLKIREALEDNAFFNVKILSYAAKYASSLYGPFRDAVNSSGALGKSNKKSYQMDISNILEALDEVLLDVEEGADLLMVKPAMSYLDVVYAVSNLVNTPVFCYQVSGEYAMIKAGAQLGWIDEKAVVVETLTSMIRAGASGIFSYYALEVADWLKS